MSARTMVLKRAQNGEMSETDPAARPRKRTFTAEYKLGILEQYESLTETGAKSALLRREGLVSSHIVEWRRARDAGALQALAGQGRRRGKTPEQAEIERLRRRNAALERELEKTQGALDVMGKLHALLETLSESADTDRRSSR